MPSSPLASSDHTDTGLIIGAIASGQRGYYRRSSTNCAQAGTIALTILAGPLNYFGTNPKTRCLIPRPSR